MEKALNRKRMDAFVMMDVHTGDVVAMASHPTFDPNIFLPTISSDEWQMLNADQYHPLLNRAIDAQYPPGSCFKTVTSIAAMTPGVFDPNWVVHCTGYFDIGNVHMDLKDEAGHNVSYQEGLAHSFNTYFITLGLKVGRDILLDTARSFNFGNLTGISLPGELPGFIPDPEFVRRTAQREFGDGDLANTSIGQGFVLVTPVQMADYMGALANGGTVYRPRLVTEIDDHDGNKVRDIPVDVDRTVTLDSPYMADLKAAMIEVCDDGTAPIMHRDDFKIAAKTGTAQVGTKEHRRQIAWLCGYFPADNPEVLVRLHGAGRILGQSRQRPGGRPARRPHLRRHRGPCPRRHVRAAAQREEPLGELRRLRQDAEPRARAGQSRRRFHRRRFRRRHGRNQRGSRSELNPRGQAGHRSGCRQRWRRHRLRQQRRGHQGRTRQRRGACLLVEESLADSA